MSAPTQPRDGDLVANCGHDELRHMFWLGEKPARVECDHPECPRLAPWLSVCDDCFAAMQTTGQVAIRSHAHWLGDEPVEWKR